MKNIVKKWWFWIIIFFTVLIIIFIIFKIIEENKIKTNMVSMVEGMSDYYKGINNSKSHIDEFNYNNTTGKVEYRPTITLEKYNNIREGMDDKEVVSIIGNYDKKSEGENTYMLEWGNAYSPVYNGYWIQIIFDTNNKVLNKYQTGLK